MYVRFSDITSRPTRAHQAWLILIGCAANRQALTYKQLDGLMKFGNPRVLGPILLYIMRYCENYELPPLSGIVKSQAEGKPSNEFGKLDFEQLKQNVFDFDWYAIVPPTPEELDRNFKST